MVPSQGQGGAGSKMWNDGLIQFARIARALCGFFSSAQRPMRPPAKPVALALLLAGGAQAQPETVNVEKSRGLEGLWQISIPAGFSVGLSGPAKFGPMSNVFCRIMPNGDVHCLSGGYPESGTASLDGNNVHIAWGSMLARMAIDGTLQGDGMSGTFTFKLSGARHDAPEQSRGGRILPPASGDDASKYLAGLLGQLTVGNVTLSVDKNAIKSHGGAVPSDILKLGKVEAVAYLGHTARQIDRPDGDLYSVHIVEFEHGERLCGVHQTAEGILDAIRCV